MYGWITNHTCPAVSLGFACFELGFDQGDDPWDGGLGFVGVGSPTAPPVGRDKSGPYDGCRFAPRLRRRFTVARVCQEGYDSGQNQAQRDKRDVDDGALDWLG